MIWPAPIGPLSSEDTPSPERLAVPWLSTAPVMRNFVFVDRHRHCLRPVIGRPYDDGNLVLQTHVVLGRERIDERSSNLIDVRNTPTLI